MCLQISGVTFALGMLIGGCAIATVICAAVAIYIERKHGEEHE